MHIHYLIESLKLCEADNLSPPVISWNYLYATLILCGRVESTVDTFLCQCGIRTIGFWQRVDIQFSGEPYSCVDCFNIISFQHITFSIRFQYNFSKISLFSVTVFLVSMQFTHFYSFNQNILLSQVNLFYFSIQIKDI